MYSYYEEVLKEKNIKLGLMQHYARQAMKQNHLAERMSYGITKRKIVSKKPISKVKQPIILKSNFKNLVLNDVEVI